MKNSTTKKKNIFKRIIKFLGDLKYKIKRELKKLDKTTLALRQIESMFAKTIPQPNLTFLCCHLVEHCNLNCKFCGHFSSLAEPQFTDINTFEKDFKRLSELSQGEVNTIALMGGEPLLHPDVKDFFYVARKYFPDSIIQLVTNGILLPKQNEEFWNACRENNINLEVTEYPININYEEIEKLSLSKNVKYHSYIGNATKTLRHYPIDLSGAQDPKKNFLKCMHSNQWVFFGNGKLYTCPVAPNIKFFNKYFNKNIKVSDRDSIDIYKAETMDEILSFLAKPIPFCKNCYISKRTDHHKWGQSKKQIEEWTI